MKPITLFFLFSFLSLSLYAQKREMKNQKVKFEQSFNQCDNLSWVLVFEDNFDGKSLDLSKWDVIKGVNRDPYFENSKQWYSPQNILLEDSVLKLTIKKEVLKDQCFDIWIHDGMERICDDFDYTTAEIWAKPFFQYGKFEARIKIPKGKGFWPAFWLFGDFAPKYNEIDVFEFWNEKNIFNKFRQKKLSRVHHMTVFYDHDNNGRASRKSSNYKTDDFSEDFYIFTLIWEKDKIEWYVNGELKRSDSKYYKAFGRATECNVEAQKKHKENTVFPEDPMRVILSVGIQNGINKKGNEKSPDDFTPFPSYMEVDWVRFYQKQ